MKNVITGQNLFFQKIKQESNQMTLKKIQNHLEQLDQRIRNTNLRKEQGYYANGYVSRTLYTSEGAITFRRTKFKVWSTSKARWQTVYLLDRYLKIKKNQKLTAEFQLKILEKINSGMSPKHIIASFPYASLHKSTISRFLKNVDVESLNKESWIHEYECPVAESETIYVSIDDTYINLKENVQKAQSKAAKHRVRLAVFYQGIAAKQDQRGSILVNKRIAYALEKVGHQKSPESIKAFAKLIKEKIYQFYGFRDWKIIVSGDGEAYIKKISLLLNADVVLDWFHLKSHLWKLFKMNQTKNQHLRRELFEMVAKNLKISPEETIIHYLIPLRQSKFLDHETTTKFIKYVRKNLPGIRAYGQDWYRGCYTESNVYHYIKSISKCRSFSVQNFKNLLSLRTSTINDLHPVKAWEQNFLSLEINYFQNFN